MDFIITLLVGGFIGFLAGVLTGKGGSMGVIYNVIAGLVGSSIGQYFFGSWGPVVAGMALVPSVLGAVILVLLVSLITRKS